MAVQRSHGSFKDFVASRTYKLRARSARSSRVHSPILLFLLVFLKGSFMRYLLCFFLYGSALALFFLYGSAKKSRQF
jgi:hypothetical protein